MELVFEDAVVIDNWIFHVVLEHDKLVLKREDVWVMTIRDEHLIGSPRPKIFKSTNRHIWAITGKYLVTFDLYTKHIRMFRIKEEKTYSRMVQTLSGALYSVREDNEGHVLAQHFDIFSGAEKYEDTVRDIASHEDDPELMLGQTLLQWESDGSARMYTTH